MPGKAVNFQNDFRLAVGKPPELCVRLSGYSHFRIGGVADYFFSAGSVPELERAVVLARQCSVPYFIIGGGYNVLFDDEGFRGLIIKNEVKGIERKRDNEIEAHSGATIRELLDFCCRENLGGLEYMAGIPGTVGGAVYGNAGAFDKDIGGRVTEALLLDEKGKKERVGGDYLGFGYRSSRLQRIHSFVLKVTLRAEEKSLSRIQAAVDEILEQRKKKHPPWHVACAGSFFRNPVLPDGKKVPAALLLDRVGARALRVGDAAVYEGHANFIINKGRAASRDVRLLASELKKRVKEEFGITLREEVILVPKEP